MPPGTRLPKPRPVWTPTQLDPSHRWMQRRGAEPLLRARSDERLSQSRAATGSMKARPTGPSLVRALTTSRKAQIARPQSPQLTLEAAAASGLSSRPAAAPEDAFLAALGKLQSLFAVEDGSEESDRVKVDQALKGVREAQRAPLDFASVRKSDPKRFQAPKLPCVFMHGLFGFSTLTPVSSLPQLTIDYWRGVVELLEENGVEVLVTNVKTSASIEERAKDALRMIEERFPGREVNLLGHSMGGLDARFLTTCLKEKTFKVKTVTTIATPHRGSPFASYLLYDIIGRKRLPNLLSLVQKLGIPGGGEAFECLTTERMKEFNEYVKDSEDTRYFSWGAAFKPGLFNEFRFPHGIIWNSEGHNDGLVSVESSKWGHYHGTLRATHIEIIGWGNAIQQWLNWAGAQGPPFDTRDFYLMVCEDLAREGF